MKKPYIVLTILALLFSCGGNKSTYQIEAPNTKPNSGSGSGTTTPTETVVKDPELPSNGAIARMKELGVGWNLGNNLDALPDGFSDTDDEYGWPDETCWSNQKATQQTFNKIKSYGFTYVRIPVYLGEYGCSMRDKNDKRAWAFYLYWLEYVTKAARAYGFPAAIWDSGGKDKPGQEKHCYTNHGTGEFLSSGREPIEMVVKAWTNNDPAYTLQSVYDKAPVF